jgi:hypothetical protein
MKMPADGQLPTYTRDPLLDDPLYRLREAAVAAAIDPGLLKSWVSREPIVLPLGRYDRVAKGSGNARLFTLRRVIAAAITQELSELGITAARAGIIATLITEKELPWRGITPGSPTGSVVILYGDGETAVFPRVGESSSLEEVFVSHERATASPVTCIAAVNIRAVFRKVMTRLAKRGWKDLPIG